MTEAQPYSKKPSSV